MGADEDGLNLRKWQFIRFMFTALVVAHTKLEATWSRLEGQGLCSGLFVADRIIRKA